ncbi:MAG: PriCT-2 domain-containing protein [Verrucomicrobiaceae bacterium]|nr:PriCT-2 domain-containing protein [Verrucomicrobiaceae bacterium]
MIPKLRYFTGTAVESPTLKAHPAEDFATLVEALKNPEILPITGADFRAMTKPEQSEVKKVPYLTACTFPTSPHKGRKVEFAEACNLIFLDIDDSPETREMAKMFISSPETLESMLDGFNFAAYRTASYTPEKPRLRIVVDADGIPPDRYAEAVQTIASHLDLAHVTGESVIVTQPMFLPTVFSDTPDPDNPMLASFSDGRPFRIEDIAPDGTELPGTKSAGAGTITRSSGDLLDTLANASAPMTGISEDEARKMLSYLSPDCSRAEWIQIGAALQHQFGEAGEDIWTEWSRGGQKFVGEADCRTNWKVFRDTPAGRSPITLRTVAKRAKKKGYELPSFKDSHTTDGGFSKLGEGQVQTIDLSQLDARRITLDKPPPKPVSVYKLAGQQICTAGNLTNIQAQAKAGKTAALGCIVAAAVASEEHNPDDPLEAPDCLGFTAAPHRGKAVILFDTEQSPYDSWLLAQRAVSRAGSDDLPPNFRFYSVADVPTAQRRAYLAAELERAKEECGGIHSVLIDGVGDLSVDPNDAVESNRLVEELVQHAIKYECPIITVLHENPSGAETGKTRGHLGSQLERKAESNLRVVKDAKGVSTIFSDRCRHASIPKESGPRFAWNDAAGMHVTVHADVKADKADEKRKEEKPAVDSVFDGTVGNLTWAELHRRIRTIFGVAERTASRRITEWTKLGLITSPVKGEYIRP